MLQSAHLDANADGLLNAAPRLRSSLLHQLIDEQPGSQTSLMDVAVDRFHTLSPMFRR